MLILPRKDKQPPIQLGFPALSDIRIWRMEIDAFAGSRYHEYKVKWGIPDCVRSPAITHIGSGTLALKGLISGWMVPKGIGLTGRQSCTFPRSAALSPVPGCHLPTKKHGVD